MAANKDSLPDERVLAGRYTESVAGGERVRAYVSPPLWARLVDRLGTDIFDLMERANRTLGRLEGARLSSVVLLPPPAHQVGQIPA